MIRKLLLLAGVIAVVRRVLRVRARPSETATIGFADGTAVVLEPGAPGLEGLLTAAREALAP
jgi:hypothetical protein